MVESGNGSSQEVNSTKSNKPTVETGHNKDQGGSAPKISEKFDPSFLTLKNSQFTPLPEYGNILMPYPKTNEIGILGVTAEKKRTRHIAIPVPRTPSPKPRQQQEPGGLSKGAKIAMVVTGLSVIAGGVGAYVADKFGFFRHDSKPAGNNNINPITDFSPTASMAPTQKEIATLTPIVTATQTETPAPTLTSTPAETATSTVITEADFDGTHFKFAKVEVNNIYGTVDPNPNSDDKTTSTTPKDRLVAVYFFADKIDVFPTVFAAVGMHARAVFYDGDKKIIVEGTMGTGKPGVGMTWTGSSGRRIPNKIGGMTLAFVSPEKIKAQNVRLVSVQIAKSEDDEFTTLYSDGSEDALGNQIK